MSSSAPSPTRPAEARKLSPYRSLRRRAWDAIQELKHRRFLLSERLNGYRAEREKFERTHGYPLDLQDPRSYNEKLCWRKIYDRNPLLPVLTDKFAVRDYVREVLGPERGEEVLIPLLFHTRDPGALPFDDLPPEYVIKANHGCAMNMILREGHSFTREEIVRRCEKWLRRVYGRYSHQWAYGQVDPQILVEELVSSANDEPPVEFKLHMFNGRCELIQLHRSPAWYDGRTPDTDPDRLPRLNYYTPDWEEVKLVDPFPSGPPEPPPPELPEALELAEALSGTLDYVRVDLYSVRQGILVGELTVYPHEGLWKFDPRDVDFELGAKWRLPNRKR